MPTNRLRVLLITARADHGGGPRHILDLLRAFHRRDIDFYIGSPREEPYADQFTRLTKKLFEIPSRSFSLFAFFRLRRAIQIARIDVIHSHGRGAGIYSRLLGLVTGCRVLHTFHGIHREPSFTGRLKLWVDQILAFLPFTPIFVSDNEQEEASQFRCVRPGRKGFVIENAVDASRFSHRQQPPFSNARTIRLGAFLRADPVKGPDLFLNLVRELERRSPDDIDLRWSCVGISRDELAAYGEIPSSIDILDRVTEPAPWLESLDVFLSTARNEGLPLGVLEAMAAGCICILSDIPAHVGFARDGGALLFDATSATNFHLQLQRLLRELDLRQDLTVHAQAMMTERHSLGVFATKLMSAYQDGAT